MTEADLLDAMTDAARAAGESLLRTPRPARPTTLAEFRRVFDEVEKPVVGALANALEGVRPGRPWADEFDTALPERGERWIVDAMDGAVQYLQGLPQWCVSLALMRDRRPVAVVLHSPLLEETYTAAAGGGAQRNGVTVTPTTKAELAATLVATSQPPFVGDEPGAVREAGRALAAALPVVGAVRNLGPTSWQIADVAAGRIDGFWQYGRDDANLLGASLIATEAGVLVTDTSGRPWAAGASSILAAPPSLHGQLLATLGR
ncbi:inositol monophosphatase family protein [Micromonospora sp. 067-2]|uniref:inositol monophosphatase family protein n=1 Tax=Micromonospora sp. 067-2 TaxID=2789270 RepID=UPI00397E4271